jgi:acyl-[acyl-carrier-protein]-phospholipid O-acyltransferase/long-chain-fatty-acid--[acyl-carrier-protein] ligase
LNLFGEIDLSDTKQPKFPLLGLLTAQFTGAFNDNAWKLIVFTLATRPLLQGLLNHDVDINQASQFQATLALLTFLVPFLLFSIPAAACADYVSKRSMIVAMKGFEVLLMAGATLSLWWAPTSLLFPFLILALLGVHSALFGPAKYGILPEILPKEKLSAGNGLSEMWTMLAIILGTMMGPILLAVDGGGVNSAYSWLAPAMLTTLSLCGFISALTIIKTPATPFDRTSSYFAPIIEGWEAIRKDRPLWLVMLGSVVYWMMTSLIGQNILVYAKVLVTELGESIGENGEMFQGIAPAAYGVGVALGAVIAGKISRGRVEQGLIPIGAIAFALSTFLLGLIQPGMMGTIVLLIVAGVSSGFLIVPIHSLMQIRAPSGNCGTIIAIGNMMDIVGMIAGSILAGLMAAFGLSIGGILILSSFCVMAGAYWAVRLLPDALIRFAFIILTRTLYKVRAVGMEHLPKEEPFYVIQRGGMTVLDALLISAMIDRPAKLLIPKEWYEEWFIHPIATILRAIPIEDSADLARKLKALNKLEDGSETTPAKAIVMGNFDCESEAETGWARVPIDLEYVCDSPVLNFPKIVSYKAIIDFAHAP